VAPESLTCIVHASGTPEQCLPDGGPLLQRELGLGGSGIRAFSVHATCLSFLVGLETACMLLARADTPDDALILVCSSEISSRHVDPTDEHVAPLFGDGAAACVVRKASWREGSALHRAHMETYADGASLTEVRGGGTNFPFHRVDDRAAPNPAATREVNHFQMDGPATMRMVLQHGPGFMERLRPGLSSGLGDIAWVVPHQASGLALDAITDALGWPAERMLRTLDRLGNVVAASIPLTLHAGVTSGRIQRGDKLLLMGTGAGLSFGGMILTF